MTLIKFIFTTTVILLSTPLMGQHVDIVAFEKLNQFLNVRDFCISTDGDEAFFTLQSPGQEISQIACIKKENDDWSDPVLLPFSDLYMDIEPFLSIDGSRLYFVSNRPLYDSTSIKKDFDIWYVDRDSRDAEWSKPKNMGAPINSALDEFYPSISENNNLYFTMVSPDGIGKDDIYFCKWEDGDYQSPVLLNENINSSGYEFNAFISRKEDFILFSRYNEEDGLGSGDLYLSTKDSDGKWTRATNLGAPINTKYMEYCPYYDEKNQILYFTSKRNNITPKKFRNVSDFKKYIQESDNGLSKIYMTKVKLK